MMHNSIPAVVFARAKALEKRDLSVLAKTFFSGLLFFMTVLCSSFSLKADETQRAMMQQRKRLSRTNEDLLGKIEGTMQDFDETKTKRDALNKQMREQREKMSALTKDYRVNGKEIQKLSRALDKLIADRLGLAQGVSATAAPMAARPAARRSASTSPLSSPAAITKRPPSYAGGGIRQDEHINIFIQQSPSGPRATANKRKASSANCAGKRRRRG